MNLSIAGIYREIEFSPGKVNADRQIMDATLDQLRSAGADVAAITAQAFISDSAPSANVVLAMCQSGAALERLAALESAGAVVINSALGIRNCYRDLLGPGLLRAAVPAPRGLVMDTRGFRPAGPLGDLDPSRPIYVKRGDLHALGPRDVQRVENSDELGRVLQEFSARGIGVAYLQEEVAGRVVKFYGVGNGSRFFTTVAAQGPALAEQILRELRAIGVAGAAALGVEVWGGDAIVTDDAVSVIDFNDWPSFGAVVEVAAKAIAQHALARADGALEAARLQPL